MTSTETAREKVRLQLHIIYFRFFSWRDRNLHTPFSSPFFDPLGAVIFHSNANGTPLFRAVIVNLPTNGGSYGVHLEVAGRAAERQQKVAVQLDVARQEKEPAAQAEQERAVDAVKPIESSVSKPSLAEVKRGIKRARDAATQRSCQPRWR